jgi:hypothetical protein
MFCIRGCSDIAFEGDNNPMAFNFLGWLVFLDNITVCDFELLVFSWDLILTILLIDIMICSVDKFFLWQQIF